MSKQSSFHMETIVKMYVKCPWKMISYSCDRQCQKRYSEIPQQQVFLLQQQNHNHQVKQGIILDILKIYLKSTASHETFFLHFEFLILLLNALKGSSLYVRCIDLGKIYKYKLRAAQNTDVWFHTCILQFQENSLRCSGFLESICFTSVLSFVSGTQSETLL